MIVYSTNHNQMGDPRARNLLRKTDSDTKLFVYDVVPAAVEKLVNDGEGRVEACGSSREVAEKSVRFYPHLTQSLCSERVS